MLLKLGMSGPAVRKLVDDLRALGFGLSPGSRYNADVKRSVETFQTANLDSLGRPLLVDGKVGDHTRWALDVALGRIPSPAPVEPGLLPTASGGSVSGRAALAVAAAEMAARRGEAGGDNRGPDVVRYLAGRVPPGSNWCAVFVSWCFSQALGRDPTFGYLVGAQAIHKRMKTLGHAYAASLAKPPLPGDIIVWRRVDPRKPETTAWMGHIGIVAGFTDGYLTTIEGNKGAFPSRVRDFRYSWSDLVTSESNDRFKGLYGLSRHP